MGMGYAYCIGIVDMCFTSVAITVLLEVPGLAKRFSVASGFWYLVSGFSLIS